MEIGASGSAAASLTLFVGGAAPAGEHKLAHRASIVIAEREFFTSDLLSIKRPTYDIC